MENKRITVRSSCCRNQSPCCIASNQQQIDKSLNNSQPSHSITFEKSNHCSACWAHRNRLEKTLIISTLMLLIILLVFFISVGIKSSNSNVSDNTISDEADSKYCLEPDCIYAASEVLKSIDTSVNPCDDFYHFACNKWIESNPIPTGSSSYNAISKLTEQNQQIIKRILENSVDDLKSNVEKKVKYYYDSCLDPNQLKDKLGSKPLLDLIEDFTGWNVTTKDFSLTNWTLQKVIEKSHNTFHTRGLFEWNVYEDDKDSSKYIIQIDQGGLTLPSRDNYINITKEHEKILTAYLDYMTKVGMMLGADNEMTVKNQMQDIIKFETKIAEITTPEEERRDVELMYNRMTINKLQEIAPFLNWHHFLNDAFNSVNISISENENVVINEPKFFQNLTNLINEYLRNDTGKIILHNYVVWQTVHALVEYLSKEFKFTYDTFNKAMTGSIGNKETWKECVTNVESFFPLAVGATFVRKNFNGNSKQRVEEMIDEIRTSLKMNFKKTKWMDEESQKKAEEKAEAIANMIGFPDYILDPEQLDNEYKLLADIRNDTFFENTLKISNYVALKELGKLAMPVNKTKWEMGPSAVNAYYSPNKNHVVFPAGILQSPFFNVKYPKSFNYGAIGTIMGHELTHAFDDFGSQYDKFGNLQKWWDNETELNFKKETECMEKQYTNCTLNGKHLKGIDTLGENIADNGGIKFSYYSFKNSKTFNKKRDSQLLPGLNMTQDQLFFLAYAQVWCSSSTPEEMNLQIENDSHAPSQFRTNIPLSNFKEFSKVFNCPIGSKMNPKHTCNVW